ncbi:MAG: FAD:protein FMN transferase [Kordiimonadaceae bacterium]|nr:FAD:protein FMN transferase [Kordiimonadaceae bacterium]
MKNLSRNQPLLGTCVEIDISAEVAEHEIIALSNLAFGEIRRIQALMSFHDPESELSRINREAHLHPVEISDDMEFVLQFARLLSDLTKGAYDISVVPELMAQGGLPALYEPHAQTGNWRDIRLSKGRVFFSRELKIDLGGIAKGYAVDAAFEILAVAMPDLDKLVINAGGDLRMQQWHGETVQIRSPDPRTRGEFSKVDMLAPAMATSAPHYAGNASLIVNRQAGCLEKSGDSISVFAPSCMIADTLTKAVFLYDAPASILARFGASGLRLTQGGDEMRVAA